MKTRCKTTEKWIVIVYHLFSYSINFQIPKAVGLYIYIISLGELSVRYLLLRNGDVITWKEHQQNLGIALPSYHGSWYIIDAS
jgi:hypothetical protein